MKRIYNNIGFLILSLAIASCSLSKRQADNEADTNEPRKIELIVLDPGHFHASLLQKDTLTDVNDTIHIYAPEGTGLNQYMESINSYNQRAKAPTSWVSQVYTGDDYLSRMLTKQRGDVVVLAGNNQKKTQYIIESIKAGYNVLSDKPLAITQQDFDLLVEAYQLAKEKTFFYMI